MTKYLRHIALLLLLVAIGVFHDEILEFNFQILNKSKIAASRTIPDSSWEEKYKDIKIKEKYKLAVFTSSGGDWFQGQYTVETAKKMGWEAKLFFKTPLGNDREFLEFDPDMVIFNSYIQDFSHFINGPIGYHKSKKYFWFVHPISVRKFEEFTIFRMNNTPDSYMRKALSVADGVLITAKEIALLESYANKIDRDFMALRFYPTPQQTDYNSFNPQKLFATGSTWDKLRRSDKYQEFLKKLVATGRIEFYGHYSKNFGNAYKGFISNARDIVPAIHECGIYLLLHSSFHLKTNTPSGRIFEAAAAGALIISDQNQFVIDNFGDNVLYFDQTQNSDIIAKQIEDHLNWIKANPEKAKNMAENTHKIFLQKFTMETQLTKLAKMHEYILAKEKAMNLKFPLKNF